MPEVFGGGRFRNPKQRAFGETTAPRTGGRQAGLGVEILAGVVYGGRTMKLFCMLALGLLAMTATAADGPYNEAADAQADIKGALSQATTAKTPVLVVFGANWCGDCKMLDGAMKHGASAPLFARDFKIVKVNVGRFDKNVELAESYGVPLKRGIPAIAILSSEGKVLYASKEGELANARKMGDQGVYDFLKRVTADALAQK